MSEDSPFLPEDTNQQATPLDLLLNAITGSSEHYPYPSHSEVGADGADGLEGLGGLLESNKDFEHHQDDAPRKRPREEELDSPRRKKIAKTVYDHILLTAQNARDQGCPRTSHDGALFSTIEVWHPRTGQKSYGKERRILNPPPTLRVKGPLLSLLTTATLASSTLPTGINTSPLQLSSQTHHIPLMPTEETSLPFRNRRAERAADLRKMRKSAVLSGFGASLPWERSRRIAREREALTDGLTFPGLWIGEEVGKGKEFQLELKLGHPGVEVEPLPADLSLTIQRDQPAGTLYPLDPSSQPPHQDQNLDTPLSDPNLNTGGLTGIDDGDHEHFVVDTDIHSLDQHFSHGSSLGYHEVSASHGVIPQNGNASGSASAGVGPGETASWATLSSAPLSIVSKPSQKTAKARSMASCLTERDSIALTIRINSQTVRTKYMKLEAGETPRLTSRTGKWSPFRLDVVRRAFPQTPNIRDLNKSGQNVNEENNEVLTYGSIIVIVGMQNGIRSEPVRLVRVEKNEMIQGEDVGQPVSELQRVGFVRVDTNLEDVGNGERWYLSAPGARAGGGELLEPREIEVKNDSTPIPVDSNMDLTTPAETGDPSTDGVPQTLGDVETDQDKPMGDNTASLGGETIRVKKRRKTRRNALALATLAEEDETATNTLLTWQKARAVNKQVTVGDVKQKFTKEATVDIVEDWMCWVITGVSCFTYSFFDSTNEALPLPANPLDPVPRLLSDPKFHPQSNTIDVLLSDLRPDGPLDIYIGPLGPLRSSVWTSTAQPGPPKHINHEYPAIRLDGGGGEGDDTVNGRRITSNWPSNQRHTLLVVELPSTEEVVQAMQELAAKVAQNKNQSDAALVPEEGQRDVHDQQHQENRIDDDDWLTNNVHGQLPATGELTIQEALRKAEEVINDEINLALAESTMIDPSLHAQGQENSDGQTSIPGEGVLHETREVHADAQVEADRQNQSIALTAPTKEDDQATANTNSVPLPILLIRREDGIGFGVGKSIVAVQCGGEAGAYEQPQWELRLVSA